MNQDQLNELKTMIRLWRANLMRLKGELALYHADNEALPFIALNSGEIVGLGRALHDLQSWAERWQVDNATESD